MQPKLISPGGQRHFDGVEVIEPAVITLLSAYYVIFGRNKQIQCLLALRLTLTLCDLRLLRFTVLGVWCQVLSGRMLYAGLESFCRGSQHPSR